MEIIGDRYSRRRKMVLGDGEVISSETWDSGRNECLREEIEIQQEGGPLQTGKRALSRPKHDGSLISVLQPPELCKHASSLSKLPREGSFVRAA